MRSILTAMLCVLCLAGCRSVLMVDRFPSSGKIQLYDGMRKVGWLAAYTTEVLTVNGKKPTRRFLYGDREEGSVLIGPGRHSLRVRIEDSTQVRWTAVVTESEFILEAALGFVYDIRVEGGVLVIYRLPDVPDGPGKGRTKEPNQALQTTPMTRSVYEKTLEFGYPQRGV